ncbi:MAG TPA: hypothetical protein VID75_05250 [Acidimicrobiales bacterium]|jgi:hypothetical protein
MPTRERNRGGVERAVITFPAPHGTEAITLCEGETASFGRGTECRIRFGYAPVPDEGVPRVAGSLLAANGRIFIESSTQPGHRALELRTAETVIQIPAGEGFSPRDSQFDLLVRGEGTPWKLGVAVRPVPEPSTGLRSDDPPTKRFSLDLTETQYAVLAAYCEPPGRARSEPATHREVAAALNYHPNTVREILYEIWARMFAEQVPMPDVSDKRVAVVEATRVHGLLWNRK